MPMALRNLSPVQQDAAQQIYDYFYDYALKQGSDASTATEFANIGVGVASGEGLGITKNPWSSNPDNGVTALGPFQLNLNSGVGSDYGLTRNSPPSDQLKAAAETMWGESGNNGTYNTGPWNAVGKTVGGSNNSGAGQSYAENIGAQYASRYNLGSGSSAPVDPGVAQDNVDAYTPSSVGQGGNPTPGDATPYSNASIAPNFGSLNQGADTSSIGNPSFADPTSNFGNSTPINPNYYSTPTITGGGGGNPNGGSSGGGGASGDWSSNPAYIIPQNGVDPSLGVANWADPTQNAAAIPSEPAVPSAQGTAKTISGAWNTQGATAVSTAGGEQAQATASAGNAVSKAINGAINKLSGAVGQSAQLTSKANTANVQGAEAAGTGWLNSIFANTRNLFQRSMIGFMGLILLLGAAMYFSRANQGA